MPLHPRLDNRRALRGLMVGVIDGIQVFGERDDCTDRSTLAKKICLDEEVEEKELRSGLRKRRVVKSRRMLCQISVRHMGYSGADVARFLGITTSAVNRLAVSAEQPEIQKYL